MSTSVKRSKRIAASTPVTVSEPPKEKKKKQTTVDKAVKHIQKLKVSKIYN